MRAQRPAGNADANPDGGSAGSEAKPDNEPPGQHVRFGPRRQRRKPSVEDGDAPKHGAEAVEPTVGTWPKFKHSLSIPILRMPTPEEVTATGWPDPSVFFGTLEVPVPSIDGFLSALSQPEPEPTPEPCVQGTTGGARDRRHGRRRRWLDGRRQQWSAAGVRAPAGGGAGDPDPGRRRAHSAAARVRPRRSADGRRRPDRRCRREGAVDPRIVVTDGRKQRRRP